MATDLQQTRKRSGFPQRSASSWLSPVVVRSILPGAAGLAYAGLGWRRRWVSDDGFITLRVVQQLLAGNGPVSNVGERVEASTSTAWTYLLALVSLVTPGPLEWAAVGLGLALSAAGLAVAVDATRRLVGAIWPGAVPAPAGLFVVLALPPFWDFATSGLETGLTFAWIGCCWWLLVRLALRDGDQGRGIGPMVTAVVFGLGPLVRPDLALPAGVMLLGLLAVVRPTVAQAAGLLATAGALPLAYEVFRAGYYGLLVPNTALAKEGTQLRPDQGLHYLGDLVGPYALQVPLWLLLTGAAAAAVVVRPVSADFRSKGRVLLMAVVAAPIVSGLLHGAYVVLIGGDFMHARLLLPAVWTVVLPVLVLPVGRGALAALPGLAAAGIAAWALLGGPPPDTTSVDGLRPQAPGIVDERRYYVFHTGEPNPITAHDYRRIDFYAAAQRAVVIGRGRSVLVVPDDSQQLHAVPLAPSEKVDFAFVFGNIGVAGQVVPLDAKLEDPLGLTSPLGSRLELTTRARPGHEKLLPVEWTVGASTLPGTAPPPGVDPVQVEAARRALGCGELARLRVAVSAPLTPGRFLRNVWAAPTLTELRIPRLPSEAAKRFCGREP